MPILKLFQKNCRERNTSKLILWGRHHPDTKTKDNTQKRKLQANIADKQHELVEQKILNKILSNRIQQHNLNRCRKSFWQNLAPIYDQNSSKNGHQRNLSQHTKGHIGLAYSKHYSQWLKTENIPPKIRNKTRVPTLITIIQHSSGSLSYSN